MKADYRMAGMIPLLLMYPLVVKASSQTIPIDDFSDGNDDGWTHVDTTTGETYGPGSFEASSGSYRLVGAGPVPEEHPAGGALGAIWDQSSDPIYSDGFLRAKIRAETEGTVASLFLRVSGSVESGLNGYLFHGSTAQGTFFFNRVEKSLVTRGAHVDPAETPFAVDEDWNIEVGAVRDELTLKAWPVGETEPEEPQLIVYDATFDSGMFAVESNIHEDPYPGPARVSAVFDDIFFTFPADRTPGDFDKDHDLDVDDVNSLMGRINGDRNLYFDVSGDGSVGDEDLQYWVKELKRTWIGDVNLDGEFNSGDLVDVFAAGKYEIEELAGWSEGDWDADMRFRSGDLVAAFSDGGYELGPRPATAAVPEPAGLLLALLAMVRFVSFRERAGAASDT